MTGEGDDRLVERLRAGDPEALGPLVDRYGSALLAYLQRLTGCREAAEDLVQEAFLRVLRAAADYRPGGPGGFRAWAYAIARNLAFDWARRRGHERRHAAALMRASADGGAAGNGNGNGNGNGGRDPGANGAGEAELRERVAAAVAALPEPFKSALVLCALEGRSYDEAAAVLGCPTKTVSSRVTRARALLRSALRGYLDADETGAASAGTLAATEMRRP